MQDKYNSLKKDLSQESTYQMLVESRNKECAKKGAIQYTVVNEKTVENDKKNKDCPLFFDTDEFYCLNDPTDDDKWGGVTTTGIFTLNTLETPESLKMILDENKRKAQLQHAIDTLDEIKSKEISITGVTYSIDQEEKITLTLTGNNIDNTKEYQWSIKIDSEEPVTRTSTGIVLEILASGEDEELNTNLQAGTNIIVTVSVDDYTSDEITVSKS